MIAETENKQIVQDDNFYADVFRVFKDNEIATLSTSDWFNCHMSSLNGQRNSTSPFRMLSIGCGDGQIDNEIVAHLYDYSQPLIEYVGVDTNLVHLEEASKNLQHHGLSTQFIHSTVEEYLLSNKNDKEFDLIIAVHCFYYIPERKETLEKLVQCLKEGGKLVVVYHSAAGIHFFQKMTNRIVGNSTTKVQVSALEIEDILSSLDVLFRVNIENVVIDVSSCMKKPLSQDGLKLLSFFLERDIRKESL